MSDSEDDALDYDDETTPEVELGFICEEASAPGSLQVHANPDWTKWDGGKVGGRPSWLCPSSGSLPSTEQLACSECRTPLSFLLQVYCPLDEQSDAFHRSLYVFVCRAAGCSQQGDGKAFRLQLPRENAFYAGESGASSLKSTDSSTHELVDPEAAVELLRTQGSKWLFPEHELEIDHEPDSREAANEYEAKLLADFEKDKVIGGRKTREGDESDPFTDDSELDVSQRELNEALGHAGDQDAQYVRFLTRVALAKDQVLRYSRWESDAVLWVHSQGIRTAAVPPCDRCGGDRKFEFQVLPQLLNYLGVDQQGSLGDISSRSCEWGTLAVYTCARSCPLETQSAQEFLHYQPAYAGAT
ncbi:hypothetical protein BBJ28_00018047 [Nothophytophthora sp. Chile5]|nr:hypothetical protein BBJ28_00018047 [Nothophytophthora sp. Chile5]